jgi:transketolase
MICLTNGIIPWGTFNFSDYMQNNYSSCMLMGIRPIYVFTHDSITGEDGPTHQPVEHLAAIRQSYTC